MVEDMLKSKEKEVRSKIEELAGAKSKITADTAMRLIRIWDNDKIEKDLIIIPSSVHEVILIPKDNEISDEEINEMIGEVNENELETVEILSNHMYLYCRRDDRIYM